MSAGSDEGLQKAAAHAAPIRVLLVEDSPVAQELLLYLLGGDPQFVVAGVAADGEEGVAAAQRLRPDIIVMDIHMPKLDGFAAARRIMETCPTRIVMVTASTNSGEVAATFRTLEAGALTILAKPVGPGSPKFAAAAEEFLRTVKSMAEIPVVRRWPARTGTPATSVVAPLPAADVRIVALGASTGGPMALQEILSKLPKDLPVPLLIVQHISASFTEGFGEWLAQAAGFAVRVAAQGERVLAGTAYIAPADVQMGLRANGTIELADAPAEHGVRPSVSYLFRSLVAGFGPAAIGVLLTGMGRDGALELKAMRSAGAVTIAQNSDSSVVFGMPGEAVALDAAAYVLDPEAIAATVARLVAHR